MTRLRAFLADPLAYWVRPEPHQRPAHEIALDARRAARLQEDEQRASECLYPERKRL